MKSSEYWVIFDPDGLDEDAAVIRGTREEADAQAVAWAENADGVFPVVAKVTVVGAVGYRVLPVGEVA